MRKSTKRGIAGGVGVGMLTVAGIAIANSVTVSSNTLSSGGTDVSACAANAKFSFTEKFVSASGTIPAHYQLDDVIVTISNAASASVAATCEGKNYRVVLTKTTGSTSSPTSGQQIFEFVSGTGKPAIVDGGTASVTAADSLTLDVEGTGPSGWAQDIHAADVTGAYIVVEG